MDDPKKEPERTRCVSRMDDRNLMDTSRRLAMEYATRAARQREVEQERRLLEAAESWDILRPKEDK